MTCMLDTAAAARLAGTTTAVIRRWIRLGFVAAVKTGRRWIVELSSLLRRLNAARPRPADRLRAGERPTVRTGRALRRYEARHAARVEARHRRTRQESPRRQAHPTTHMQRAIVAAANAGYTTAADYLLAIGFPESERYASAFGREVAKQYRKTHGEDPYRGCLAVVHGRMQHVFGYEDIADLYAGAYSYARTREFLAAQRAASLHALAA